jgi:D-alanyl-D-alanine carboxypeptidase
MKITTKAISWFCLILGLCLTTTTLASAQENLRGTISPQAIEAVDRIFTTEYARESLAGATVGVVSEGRLIWTKNYGYADIERQIAPTNDTVYRIGSVSKQFAAVALLQLAGKDKLRLSDPVEKYFPEIKLVGGTSDSFSPITLLQLATHTSGLPREPEPAETYTQGPESDWEKTVIKALPTIRYQYEPGTHYSYSNIGYAILGIAISRVAGQSYTAYIQDNILSPLGLTSTAFVADPKLRERLAKGYVLRGGNADPSPAAKELQEGRGYKVPNGALFSTVGDLAKFIAFEMGLGPETVLPHQVIQDNFSRVFTVDGGFKNGYGLGFQSFRKDNLVIAGHGGSVAGYTAGAYFIPGTKVGVIFLRNAGLGFSNNSIANALEELTK